jgi:hypothetical protein
MCLLPTDRHRRPALAAAAGGNQPINLVAKLGDYSLMMLHRAAAAAAAKRQTDGGNDISAADE